MTHKRPTNEIVWEALSSLCAQVLEDMDVIAVKQTTFAAVVRASRIQAMLGFLVATGHLTIEEFDASMKAMWTILEPKELESSSDETPEVG